MTKKMICSLLVAALLLTSGGIRLAFSTGAEVLTGQETKHLSEATLEDNYDDSRVIVKLTNEESLRFENYLCTDFPEIECVTVQDLSAGVGARVEAMYRGETSIAAEKLADTTGNSIRVDGYHKILCLELENPGKGNVLQAVKALEQRADVLCATPDYIIQPRAIVTPDLPSDLNWAAGKIDIPEAHSIETGNSSVLVGVIDSGIDSTHPGLTNKVSATLSRDFTDNTPNTGATIDSTGQGTMVAGIIAGSSNNSIGVGGVCRNISLVSLKIFTESGAPISRMLAAMDYASSIDIPILHIGFTIEDSVDMTALQFLQNEFWLYPGLIICAAGDDGLEIDAIQMPLVAPASWTMSNIISVGASTMGDGIATFSNYGPVDVDLFAPGHRVATCLPYSICSASNCSVSGHITRGYHYGNSTSMASAYVAGVAALILSAHPETTREAVKMAILDGVDIIDAFEGKCVSEGRLNAYKALSDPDLHTTGAFYDSYNATQHWTYCDCGYRELENHYWGPDMTCMFCFYPNN